VRSGWQAGFDKRVGIISEKTLKESMVSSTATIEFSNVGYIPADINWRISSSYIPTSAYILTGNYISTGNSTVDYIPTGDYTPTGDYISTGDYNLTSLGNYIYDIPAGIAYPNLVDTRALAKYVASLSTKTQFAWKLKTNLNIVVKSRASEIGPVGPAERVALEALREVVSEVEFRKYLRYGFVLIKGRSGDVYQIFRNKAHTKVWRNGKVVEEICVRIKHDQNVPPTDNVIAFRQIIQTSEEEFKKLGNVYHMAA
jgi:hypothetical protein